MNCGQFETRLNLVLDQRRSPASDPVLAAHAAVCANCDELMADHMALVACASRSRVLRPRPDFAERVVAATGSTAIHQRRTRRLFMAACVALSSAAAMLLAISIVWKAREAGPDGGEQIAVRDGINSADVLMGATGLWSRELAMASSSWRLEEVDNIAPGIRPWRQSLAVLWDALRQAFQSRHGENAAPNEDRTSHWSILALDVV
jgi:hypothetical protein